MEKIKSPTALKKIIAFVGNFVLFLVYYYIAAFLMGFVVGLYKMFLGIKEIDQSVYGIIVIIAFIAVVVLSIIFRKTIFFRVVNHEDVVPVDKDGSQQ